MSVTSGRLHLTAGEVSAVLDGAELRDITVSGVVLAERIYVAVRDERWNTIPPCSVASAVDATSDRFAVEVRARHTAPGIDFQWNGRIHAAANGVSFEVDGRFGADSRYAKIGLNVHHPLHTSLGRPYVARGPSGTSRGRLPVDVAPQTVDRGYHSALFEPYDRLEVTIERGAVARFEFDGELFEMQDHRNWTDANFKSYCRPMRAPWPVEAAAGSSLRQRVSGTLDGRGSRPVRRTGEVRARILDDVVPLPRVGTAMPSLGDEVPPEAVERLLELPLAHLRVDVAPAEDPAPSATCEAAARLARALGVGLEVAMYAPSEAEIEPAVAALASSGAEVERVLLFHENRAVTGDQLPTPDALLRTAREALGDVALFGGTSQFFTEINRRQEPAEAADGIAWSVNPQGHVADDQALMENVDAIAPCVETGRGFLGDVPIAISPLELVGRWGPFPAGPTSGVRGLPHVDLRHATSFGAAWLVAALTRLAGARVASVTVFEALGARGLVAGPTGVRLGLADAVDQTFPAHSVLRAMRGASRAHRVAGGSSRTAEILALSAANGTRWAIVANLTPEPIEVAVDGLPGAQTLTVEGYEVTIA